MDSDLASIQEARDLASAAFEAQKVWAKATQAQVDSVCAAMAEAGFQASERLGQMASEETGYGVPAHKKLKNEFGSRCRLGEHPRPEDRGRRPRGSRPAGV